MSSRISVRAPQEARVLIINARAPAAGIGGAEAAVGWIAKAIAATGTPTALAHLPFQPLAERGSDSLAIPRFELAGSELALAQQGEQIGIARRIAAHFDDLRPSQGFAIATRILRTFEPTIVVTNNVRGVGVGTLRACAKANAVWIHIPHDVQLLTPSGLWALSDEVATVWDSPPVKMLYAGWMRRYMAGVDAVLAPSEFIARVHREAGYFSKATMVVARLPSTTVSLPREVAATPTSKSRSDDAPLRIAMIGRLSRHKGYVWALRALEESTLATHVTVCGSGEDSAEISCIRAQRHPLMTVDLRGQVGPKERAEVLAASDLLLVPSLVHENSPLVIEEAAVAGIPIVASRSGGISEFIKRPWMFAPGDKTEFVRVLERFVVERPATTHLPVSRPTPDGYARLLLHTANSCVPCKSSSMGLR